MLAHEQQFGWTLTSIHDFSIIFEDETVTCTFPKSHSDGTHQIYHTNKWRSHWRMHHPQRDGSSSRLSSVARTLWKISSTLPWRRPSPHWLPRKRMFWCWKVECLVDTLLLRNESISPPVKGTCEVRRWFSFYNPFFPFGGICYFPGGSYFHLESLVNVFMKFTNLWYDCTLSFLP